MPRATLTWKGERRFDAEVEGHQLVIDGHPGGAGAGPSPMQLMLPALGGCSGIDVVAILEKMRVAVTGLSISVDGVRRDRPFPKIYAKIDVLYTVRGLEVPAKAVEDAIRLSRDRYCSVTAMLSGPEIAWRYRIEDDDGRVTAEGTVS
ncbi:MAG: OsmC family protein [Acidobacteria bacterium]|jgi:putative redox protein|nr:OsmC family protein [Acidobacteriota bacterium]